MRGKTPENQLLFDPEIERIARRNYSKTRKHRKLAKPRNQEEGTSTLISLTSPKQEKVMDAKSEGGQVILLDIQSIPDKLI